ncbi:hypothetical protein KP509_18G036200 [Ceratopteris richardii]|uniref:Trichome birefringence-like N-terminal domain-containing protein n=1 Tax=Ceratopteris richardii TaxID=49495 RepID=A0A8T2SSH2_CERRI|nr:hypothetical protein KP509_18G036200 [Ceratopteris richardii]
MHPRIGRCKDSACLTGRFSSIANLNRITMTEDNVGRRGSSQGILQQQYSVSVHAGWNLFLYIGLVAFFTICCLWLLLRPYQNSDLFLPSTIDRHITVSDSITSEIEIDHIVYDTGEVKQSASPVVGDVIDEVKTNHVRPIPDENTIHSDRGPIFDDITSQSDDASSDIRTHNISAVSKIMNTTVNGDVASPTGNTRETIKTNETTTSSVFQCNLWQGEWIPDSTPPLYTNESCRYINPLRNCLLNGRPDRDYLYWRWKPFDCELPRFNASHFLEMLQGKRLAFIGDSLARDHGESLVCALTQVAEADNHEWPLKWFFPSYNFTLVILWAPYLIQYSVDQNDISTLHLDVPDKEWSHQLKDFDISVFSTGYWHFRKGIFYANNTLLGASDHAGVNITKFDFLTEFRMTMQTVLRYIATEYRGVALLRTVTTDHFEHGQWDAGGKCNRTRPYASHDANMGWIQGQMNRVQIEEFEKAMAMVNQGSPKLLLLNTTQISYLRPDGHPDIYRGEVVPDGAPHDCLHWCVPGPVDTWNQLLLYTLQRLYTFTLIPL